MASHYLTSYQKDYYWMESDPTGSPVNEYQRRLVWSKCRWRWFPRPGQTVFTRHYQPWGILPRWPHLFTIDETHEHPRDEKELERHAVAKALAGIRNDQFRPAIVEEDFDKRIPFLPPIRKDGNTLLYEPKTDITRKTFTAPIWYRRGREIISGKDQDKVVRVTRPRYPFEYPRWETVHMHDYKWDFTTD